MHNPLISAVKRLKRKSAFKFLIYLILELIIKKIRWNLA